MTPTTLALKAAEGLPLPDAILRTGVGLMVGRTAEKLAAATDADDRAFVRRMADFPIALHTADANAQHYELPSEFFGLVLGPRRKYSSCLYDKPGDTLKQAEERALAETQAHADLADGQDILELGCGWGSLTLWMAEQLPKANITAVSNSRQQRAFIEAEVMRRGLYNVRVLTADMNTFDPTRCYDRIVSVEMFEHMANWQALLRRVQTWLRPEGRLFLHVFTHRSGSYRFDHADKDDWIAQHFFTGGIMPSQALAARFPEVFVIEDEWRWSGEHYRRTADDWLANFDRNRRQIDAILRGHYGAAAPLWRRRWRLFFLATSGLFGHAGGADWGVSHYRLAPVGASAINRSA
ncbi:SAM-dependent methyltransferase [Lichenihabitans psoromatis]|uniref:SAM-dependent methyltransferase n=1 Tax=Lichenihabitans psoromatis TaxID=2528642 RepID=UPI001036AAE7|nr:cyclopropane-fatty-acyl-phospholipid synthase family protein [Lichenihabitans psoromatis]